MTRGAVCRLALPISAAVALAVIFVALGAGSLGLDADQRWGPFRVGLLTLGAAWLGFLGVLHLVNSLDEKVIARREMCAAADAGRAKRGNLPFARSSEGIASDSGTASVLPRIALRGAPGRILLGVVFVLAVELIYAWYASTTMMTEWPATTEWYGWLGQSFARGRLDLPIEPPPALAEVGNPYDPSQRPGIPVVEDASYFRGRYYAYWGPAPAAFTALWYLVTQRGIGDSVVAFLGESVAFLCLLLVLLHLRARHFPRVPGWLLGIGALTVAFAHPMLWNLSYPRVYEAAIAWGQAFLMAGLLISLPVVLGTASSWPRLVAAAVVWGLAIASRYTLAPAVFVLVLATMAGARRSSAQAGKRFSWGHTLPAVLLPLGLAAATLGGYNYARFGRATETGLRYQMQPKLDFTRLARTGEIFNVRYLAPNLIYYAAAPLRTRETFPFIGPVRGSLRPVEQLLRGVEVPAPYSVEDITGYLVAVPFAVFGLVFVLRRLCVAPAWATSVCADTADPDLAGVARLGASLVLAALLTAVPVLLYRHAASRFMLDYSPMIVLASVIGAWELNQGLRERPVAGRVANTLILAAAVWTIAVGGMLAILGPASLIDDYNPALWQVLTQIQFP